MVGQGADQRLGHLVGHQIDGAHREHLRREQTNRITSYNVEVTTALPAAGAIFGLGNAVAGDP